MFDVRCSVAALLALLCLICSTVAEEPAPWHWPPSPVPRALLVEGPWTDTFRLREACHVAGLPYLGAYLSKSPYFHPNTRLYGMPSASAEYAQYAVIVLSNMDAVSLSEDRLDTIERFVREGGGLVVLGGYWAYSRGAYEGTALEEMLPVTFPKENRIPPAYDGARLVPAPGADWDLSLRLDAGPAAFFVQHLIPKDGAAVQLMAGDRPAVVSGRYGKGRVVACSLTVNGVAPEGVLAYWDWEDWPALLGQAIDWAAGARPAGSPLPAAEEPLDDDELTDLALGMEVTPELVHRATLHPSASVADALFDACLSGESKACSLAAVHRSLLPFAKPAWAPRLVDLTGPMNADVEEQRAALRLLGASRGEGVRELLRAALNRDDSRTAALDGLGLSADPAAVPAVRKTLEDAMAAAAWGEDPSRLDPDTFAGEYGQVAAHAALALYRLGDESATPQLAALYGQFHLCNRVFRNAGKRRVRAQDVQGMAKVKIIWERARQLKATLRSLRDEAGPVPESQVSPFVSFAGGVTDPAQVEWVVAAMEQSTEELPLDALTALCEARDGIVARLARALRMRRQRMERQ